MVVVAAIRWAIFYRDYALHRGLTPRGFEHSKLNEQKRTKSTQDVSSTLFQLHAIFDAIHGTPAVDGGR